MLNRRVLHSGTCLIDGCYTRIQKAHLFCQAHWDLVADDLRDILSRAYTPSQEEKSWLIRDTFRRAVEVTVRQIRRLTREVEV